MRKKLWGVALAAVAALAVTACSAGEEAAQEAETEASGESQAGTGENGQEPVTLRFSWWGGESRHKATIEAVEAF